jgi:hypothetical protein
MWILQAAVRVVSLLAVLGTSVARAQGEAPAPGPNLAADPGFEARGEADRPAAWSAPAPVYTLVTDRPRSGTSCLRFENREAGRYLLCSQALALTPGKQYEFEAWVRTEGVTGEDTGATLCLQWSTKEGAYLGGDYPAGVKGTQGEWTRVRAITSPIPANAAAFDVTVYVRQGMTGVAWWDDVAVREYLPPLVDGMTTDAYRGETAGGPVAVRAGLRLLGHDLAPAQVAVTLRVRDAQGQTVATVAPARVLPDAAEFTLDATPLRPGTYELQVNVQSNAGQAQGSASCRLVRVEQAVARRAVIDRHGRLLLDGQPFFPLGTYWGGIDPAQLDLYAQSAFNCLMPYGGGTREQLDQCQARGLKVIYSVKDYYAGIESCPPQITTEADERPALEAKVKEVGDHPAIIAWYINDELPVSMMPRLSAHRDWMEQLDPSRPTWVVLFQYTEVRSYLPSYDVIGTDPYPIPNLAPRRALDYTRDTVAGSFNCRAVWMVPQIMDWAAYRKTAAEKKASRPPTLAEMRSMAWQCIAAGANGLVFYSWFDLWRMDKDPDVPQPFAGRWQDVAQMAAEIKGLFPVLLAVDPVAAPTRVDAPDGVAWRLYAKDGKTYLVAVNAERVPATARLTFLAEFAAAEQALGDTPAAAKGAQLDLTLAPLEVKVLRLTPR